MSWGDTQIKECKEVIINPLSHPPLKLKQNSGFSQAKPMSKLQFAGLNRVIALTRLFTLTNFFSASTQHPLAPQFTLSPSNFTVRNSHN